MLLIVGIVFLTGLAVGLLAGMLGNRGGSGKQEVLEREVTRSVRVDTVRVAAPEADAEVAVREEIHRFAIRPEGAAEPRAETTSRGREDKTNCVTGWIGEVTVPKDSVAVEIPITQKHYGDSTYEAWVSGYMPKLDSIRVYARTEKIRVREYKPPNRWHVGVTAGYGYTPHGFEPFIGISLTYSIFDF